MRLRALILSLISITCVSVSLTIVESQKLTLKNPTKPLSTVWNLYMQDLPAKWRMLYPEFRAPKTHEPRKQSRSDELTVTDKLKFFDKYFGVPDMRLATNERERNKAQDKIITRKKFSPDIFEPFWLKDVEEIGKLDKDKKLDKIQHFVPLKTSDEYLEMKTSDEDEMYNLTRQYSDYSDYSDY